MNILASERIKSLRESKGYTQTELANTLKITRSSVNAWEMGLSMPSTEKIIELAKFFNVSSDFILGISNEETVNLSKYNEYEKKMIYNLLSYFDDSYSTEQTETNKATSSKS